MVAYRTESDESDNIGGGLAILGNLSSCVWRAKENQALRSCSQVVECVRVGKGSDDSLQRVNICCSFETDQARTNLATIPPRL